jgi:hypothetical protein
MKRAIAVGKMKSLEFLNECACVGEVSNRKRLEKTAAVEYHQLMTRSEAIAIITATLPALNEGQAATLAELAQTLAQSPVALSLTDEDRDGIARAREDFRAGRTHSSSEARAMTAAFLAKLRGASPAA